MTTVIDELPINLRHHVRKRAGLRDAGIDSLNPVLDLILPSRVHLGLSTRLAPLQKGACQSQLPPVRQSQSLLSDLSQLRTHEAIVPANRNLSRRAFFAANTMVGWVRGFYEKWPAPNSWVRQAAFAEGWGLCLRIGRACVID